MAQLRKDVTRETKPVYHGVLFPQYKNDPTDEGRVSYGEPTSIILEHLFDDLFTLRDRFKELGMVIKDGKVYLPDVEERDV